MKVGGFDGNQKSLWCLRSLSSRGKLLCIEKTRGPYQHRFDLPGGSQELGEGLTETLKREVLEETGYTISRYANPRMYDVMVQEEGERLRSASYHGLL